MSANLTSGNLQRYETAGMDIFQGLKPDVVAIQEFNYGNNAPADFRAMVDMAFGTNFVYYRESGYNIPNGIISRFPILASGSWDDPLLSDRGFAWAQLDLPGTSDLYVVSVHLYGSGTATDRDTEAAIIKNCISTNFPAGAWVVVAGDFNTSSRSEAAVTTFKTFLSDDPIPTDAVSGGNPDTNEPRNKPYDYVLPSFTFGTNFTPVALLSHTFTNGLVFDSAVYTPLSDVPPVAAGDSHVTGMQHMGVVKDFLITYTVTNAPTDVPTIQTQPQSQTVEPGADASFTVVASGAATLTYQWRFDGAALEGATASSYTRTNAQPADAGSYSVLVTNAYGSLTSSAAILKVGTAPTITGQPQGQSVNAGVTVVFNVTATGTLPLAYQWRLNGSDVSGATDSAYSRANVQTTDAGSYSVLVTNIAGSVTSATATLSVSEPPAITSQPQSLTNFVGQDATFAVGATGAAPLSFQWRFNGADIAAATSTSYIRASVQTSDAGTYLVVVTNAVGARTSSPAVLTVTTQPMTGVIAQWNFNDTTVSLTAPPPSTGSGTSSLVTALTPAWVSGSGSIDTASPNTAWSTTTYPGSTTGNKTAGVQFNVSTAGKQNIVIRWDQRASSTGSKYCRLQYTTNGTTFYDFPTSVSVAGTTFEAKTNDLSAFPGVNNNASLGFRIVTEFQNTATGSGNPSYVGATGTYATTGTLRFDMVTVSGSTIPPALPPGIATQPQSQTVNQGATVTFNVLATSGEPPGYQWRFNSAPISGATGSAYWRTNVQPADMGSYSVVVTNSAGSTNSSNAVLSLVVPAPFLTTLAPGLILWQGLSNLPYRVEAKTNISEATWLSLGTVSSPTAEVSFTNQAVSTQRFYRVVYP